MAVTTELVLINTWFQANLLSLNVTKTSFIIFGHKKNLTATSTLTMFSFRGNIIPNS